MSTTFVLSIIDGCAGYYYKKISVTAMKYKLQMSLLILYELYIFLLIGSIYAAHFMCLNSFATFSVETRGYALISPVVPDTNGQRYGTMPPHLR